MAGAPHQHFFKVCFYTLDGITTSEVEGSSFTIGRSEKCDLQLESPSISRRHLRFKISDGVVSVEDLGSSTGTRLGSVELEPGKPLKYRQGDLVQIGKSEVFVRVTSGTSVNIILNEPDLSEKVVEVMHSSKVSNKLKGWLEKKVGNDGFNLGASLRHQFLKTLEEMSLKEDNIDYQAEDIIRAANKISDKIQAKANADGKKVLEACHGVAEEFQHTARAEADEQAGRIVGEAEEQAKQILEDIEADKVAKLEQVLKEVEQVRQNKMTELDRLAEEIHQQSIDKGEEEKNKILSNANSEKNELLEKAKAKSEELVKEAKNKAQAASQEKLTSAETKASGLVQEAHEKAQDLTEKAEKELSELQAKLDGLSEKEKQVKSELEELSLERDGLKDNIAKVLDAADQEVLKLKQETQAEINQAMQLANQKADELMLQAKERARLQLENSEKRSQNIVDDAEGRAQRILSEADDKVKELVAQKEKQLEAEEAILLKEAQTEADELLRSARAQAKVEVAEAKEKSVQIEEEVQKLKVEQRQIQELMDQLEEKAGGEEERLERLRSQQKEFAEVEAKLALVKEEYSELDAEFSDKAAQLEQVNSELSFNAKQIDEYSQEIGIAEEQLTELQAKIKEEEEQFNVETRFASEKFKAEQKSLQKELAQELAEEKLKRMREIETQAKEAEQKMQSQIKAKISRIAQDIELQMFQYLKRSGHLLDDDRANAKLARETFAIVDNVLGKGEVKQRDDLKAIVDYDPESAAKLKRFWIQSAVGAIAIVVGISFIVGFEKQIKSLGYGVVSAVKNKPSASDLYTKSKIEQIRQESVFSPDLTPEYKGSYTDNVVYTNNYLEFEGIGPDGRAIASAALRDKWILEVNTYFVEDLELPEATVVKVLGKEAGLLKLLSEMRGSIDARTAELRIGEMRVLENSFLNDLQGILGSKKRVAQFLSFKRNFYNKNCNCL